MTCVEALDRMLEADPGELEAGLAGIIDAGGATELAAHIRSCERCAAVARTLRSELEALDAGLAELARDGGPTDHGSASGGHAPRAEAGGTDPDAADAAANAALAAARAGSEPDVVPLHPPRGARPKGRGSWTRRAWIPLAAAAALAGILVVGQEQPLPPSDATAQTEAIDPRVSVVPPADRGAAIMETENPNITIVWLYETEGS
ncbi:MAG: hypothetical protein R3314_13550 [Longimicrobiales bacterium]|nr:hypothetical protein [Longimicrobiales bacterium]